MQRYFKCTYLGDIYYAVDMEELLKIEVSLPFGMSNSYNPDGSFVTWEQREDYKKLTEC